MHMLLIGPALIILAVVILFLMRERPSASKLMNQPFLVSMIAAATSGLFAVGVVMVIASFASH